MQQYKSVLVHSFNGIEDNIFIVYEMREYFLSQEIFIADISMTRLNAAIDQTNIDIPSCQRLSDLLFAFRNVVHTRAWQ